MVGEERLDFLGPFGEAIASGVEVFLIAYVECLVEVFQPVEVEVVDGFPVGATVFVDDGEGGAADVLLHSEVVAESLYEGGFPDSHFAEEGEEAFFGVSVEQLPGYLWQLLYGVES